MENQWFGRFTARKALHPAEEDEMVAARIMRLVAALEPRRATFDQGHAGKPAAHRETAEAPVLTTREGVRNSLLIDGEDIDRVSGGLSENVEPRRVAGKAPENQRWLQRHGVEGTDGDADRFAHDR